MALLFSPTRVRISICRLYGSCVVTRAHFIQPEPPVQHLAVRYSTGLRLLCVLFYMIRLRVLSVEFQVANRSSVLRAHTEEKNAKLMLLMTKSGWRHFKYPDIRYMHTKCCSSTSHITVRIIMTAHLRERVWHTEDFYRYNCGILSACGSWILPITLRDVDHIRFVRSTKYEVELWHVGKCIPCRWMQWCFDCSSVLQYCTAHHLAWYIETIEAFSVVLLTQFREPEEDPNRISEDILNVRSALRRFHVLRRIDGKGASLDVPASRSLNGECLPN